MGVYLFPRGVSWIPILQVSSMAVAKSSDEDPMLYPKRPHWLSSAHRMDRA